MNFVLRTSGLARNPIARSGLTTNFMGHPIGPIYRVRVAAASEQLCGSRQLTTACLIAGKSLNMAEAKMVIIFDFDRTLIDDDSDRWVVENMGLTHLFNQLRPALPWNALMVTAFPSLLISILLCILFWSVISPSFVYVLLPFSWLILFFSLVFWKYADQMIRYNQPKLWKRSIFF